MVWLGGQFGAEIKTNSAQLNLELWLCLATNNYKGIQEYKMQPVQCDQAYIACFTSQRLYSIVNPKWQLV